MVFINEHICKEFRLVRWLLLIITLVKLAFLRRVMVPWQQEAPFDVFISVLQCFPLH